MILYEDGGSHCFACGYHTHSTDGGEETGITTQYKLTKLVRGEFKALTKRGITEETCRKFGYSCGRRGNQNVQIADYTRDGVVVAQKLRYKDKRFQMLLYADHAPLFGQHLWREGGRRLVVTEGEIDALSVSQLQDNKWPVVSVPNGAAGASKVIAQELQFIESYDTVVFAFDMDEPGQEAAKECAQLLSPGKARIAHLPGKDANECLMAGKGKELIAALWEAKPYRPDGVVDVASLVEEALVPVGMGRSWPWEPLTRATYGRRYGELIGFGGGTGCGKTTIIKQIMLHLLNNGEKVGAILLEEQPAHTLKTLAGMKMKKRVHVPGVEYSADELAETMWSFDGDLYLYDHFGASTWSTLRARIKWMVRSLGCRDIFLDHLTALAASIESDERRSIDRIMSELSSLCQELDCTIYYISHLATPDGTPHEEGGRVQEKHFRGSRSIAYWSHFLFGIERDKQEVSAPITFRVLKDRYTGDGAGQTFLLKYDTDTGLLNVADPLEMGSDPTEDF